MLLEINRVRTALASILGATFGTRDDQGSQNLKTLIKSLEVWGGYKKKKRLGPKTTHNTRPLSDETRMKDRDTRAEW